MYSTSHVCLYFISNSHAIIYEESNVRSRMVHFFFILRKSHFKLSRYRYLYKFSLCIFYMINLFAPKADRKICVTIFTSECDVIGPGVFFLIMRAPAIGASTQFSYPPYIHLIIYLFLTNTLV